jgi:type VI secretion system secreted protein VgrG
MKTLSMNALHTTSCSTRLARFAPLALLLAACGSPMDDLTEADIGSASSGIHLAGAAPSLGAAAQFAALGASTVTCANSSSVTGDVGVSPGTALTGFGAVCTLTGARHAGDAIANQAHADLFSAYDALQAADCEHDLTGQELGGQTLAPGVYCFDTTAGLTGALTLDGGGDSDAVWIFQIGTALTTATSASVKLAGSGGANNVFWKVGSSATLGTGTAFQGNLLALASITLVSGSQLTGRALALNAAVTLDHNAVSLPR